MGDDVQAIKAGIMEIADVFVINKADQPGADRLEREMQALQSLSYAARRLGSADHPTVATDGQGIAKRWPPCASFLARADAKQSRRRQLGSAAA